MSLSSSKATQPTLKPITAAAVLVMFAFPAHADVTGPAWVTDGDTLVVNGNRNELGELPGLTQSRH